MLFEMAKEVCEELDTLFRFKYQDVEGQIYSLADPTAQKMYLTLLGARGESEEAAKEDLRKRLARERNEVCHYVSDIFTEKGSPDYIIFVPDVSDVTRVVLGEEVTHGEHSTQHIRDNRCYGEFLKKFSSPTREFIGMLGVYHIASLEARRKDSDVSIDLIPPKVVDGSMDQDKLGHWIGYLVASQLLESGEEVPYSGIFHAPDQKTVWSMVKEIVRPSISLPAPGKNERDAVYQTVLESLGDCELDAPFDFLE